MWKHNQSPWILCLPSPNASLACEPSGVVACASNSWETEVPVPLFSGWGCSISKEDEGSENRAPDFQQADGTADESGRL